ncbi:unannotated protein [freshwater metagenome]|uniref:Unannotated protein n=1 Tax=freshwater metagenome TaxID=449393 RepID=A0A6J6FR93_9ZZZZ
MFQASRARVAMSSSVSRYGVPRKLSDRGPLLNPQNLHLNVHTLV